MNNSTILSIICTSCPLPLNLIFGKSLTMACSPLGDVNLQGLILVYGLSPTLTHLPSLKVRIGFLFLAAGAADKDWSRDSFLLVSNG